MTVKKMSGIDELSTLLNSRRQGILIHTFEEERFQEDLILLLEAKGMKAYTWTITSGLKDLATGDQVERFYDPIKLLDFIERHENSAVFILKDFHDIWNNYQAKRKLRDVLEVQSNPYKPILLISPQISIPMELEKLITMIDYELPSREQVEEQLEGMEAFLRSRELPVPEGRERVAIINALVGMTKSEIVNVLKKSVSKNGKIVLDEIVAEKAQVIKKTGLLEYVTKLGNMDHVGGMDILKDWLEDAKYAFEFEAKEFNIDTVKGVILTGFPGTGKSLSAKSIAYQWNLPLMKLEMSSIMDSKVGQSEKNIDRALKLAEDVSPCVLWIDEFEKALGGMSTEQSDGGTMRRVGQSILTWLSDKEAPVFVVATANSITNLPPELTRAGRFDEVFFISVPHQKEREDIFKIHLQKRGYEIGEASTGSNVFAQSSISSFAELTKGFTGAEIEQVVAEAGRRAYADFRKGNRNTHHIIDSDIYKQIEQIVPLAKRNPELLKDLRNWAKQSAKCASSEEHQLLHGEMTKVEKEPSLIDLDFSTDLDLK